MPLHVLQTNHFAEPTKKVYTMQHCICVCVTQPGHRHTDIQCSSPSCSCNSASNRDNAQSLACDLKAWHDTAHASCFLPWHTWLWHYCCTLSCHAMSSLMSLTCASYNMLLVFHATRAACISRKQMLLVFYAKSPIRLSTIQIYRGYASCVAYMHCTA